MFKNIKGHGQVTTEYIVIFFLAIGALVSMSVFVQRSLQGRIRDARTYMISETAKAHEGNIQYEYEPYYGYVGSTTVRNQEDTTKLLVGGGTGVFLKTLNQQANVTSVSQQAAPKDAQ